MVQVGGGILQLKPSLETESSCGTASQVKPPKLRTNKWYYTGHVVVTN